MGQGDHIRSHRFHGLNIGTAANQGIRLEDHQAVIPCLSGSHEDSLISIVEPVGVMQREKQLFQRIQIFFHHKTGEKCVELSSFLDGP